MPVTALSLTYIAALIRYTRNATLDVLGQDYLRTGAGQGAARAHGDHASRHAQHPDHGALRLRPDGDGPGLCGCRGDRNRPSPGGESAISSSRRRSGADYPVLQFGVLAVASAVIVINILTDIAYALVDPRVRLGARTSMTTPIALSSRAGSGGPLALWHDAGLLERGAFILGLTLLAAALFAPYIAPVDPNAQSLLARLRPPLGFDRAVSGYWLGTDELGRDILSRSLHALRLTIGLALAGATLGMLLGLTLGLIAGLVGGNRG